MHKKNIPANSFCTVHRQENKCTVLADPRGSMVCPKDSVTPNLRHYLFLAEGGGLAIPAISFHLPHVARIWYTQNIGSKLPHVPGRRFVGIRGIGLGCVMSGSPHFVDLFLRGGVRDFHVREFFLSDGADGVGIYRRKNIRMGSAKVSLGEYAVHKVAGGMIR